MDYSKLSDFEINKMVGKLRYPDAVKSWDFCNNPSDAWPIIVENDISLVQASNDYHDGGWEAIPKAYYDYDCLASDVGEGFRFMDTNPLRAAMIVYLMMQEQ